MKINYATGEEVSIHISPTMLREVKSGKTDNLRQLFLATFDIIVKDVQKVDTNELSDARFKNFERQWNDS